MRWWLIGAGLLLAIGLTGYLLKDAPSQKVAEKSASGPPVPLPATAPVETRPVVDDQEYDWGAERYSYGTSQNLCRSVKAKRPPPSDVPDAKTVAGLDGCDSEALYYGIGMRADPVRARQCAFIESEAGENGWFAGRAMLMTIYANGVGAGRDLDLAIHYACTLAQGAPMEYDGRVMHLAAMAKQSKPASFHYCDDITSGMAAGACAGHRERLEEAKREKKIAQLSVNWSPRSKAAFAALRKAQKEYGEAHADYEQNLDGTLRGAFVVEEREKVARGFLKALQQLAMGKQPGFSPDQARDADALLNQRYREMLNSETRRGWQSSDEELRETQRKWLRYRDAFVAFAAIQFPEVTRNTLVGRLSEQRSRLILSSVNGCSVARQCPDTYYDG